MLSVQAIWWVVLTWRDPGAAAAVAASTASVLSAAEAAVGGRGGFGAACSRPYLRQQLRATGCGCLTSRWGVAASHRDGVWLPHIEMPNPIIEYIEVGS